MRRARTANLKSGRRSRRTKQPEVPWRSVVSSRHVRYGTKLIDMSGAKNQRERIHVYPLQNGADQRIQRHV